jgi:adenylate kinase
MRLVIFGPQGAGKGTQSRRIAEKYDVPVVSTGDTFRWAIAKGTDVGRQAEQYVSAGRLVPDAVTIGVVRERLQADDCSSGFLLDGFPRNRAQAEALDEILGEKGCELDAAIALEVSQETSLRRLTGRRVCSQCGRNYHVDAPPQDDWKCDSCGGSVVARSDDQDEEAIRERLKVYREQTAPLRDYYSSKGKLREIDGEASPDEVFDRIAAAL